MRKLVVVLGAAVLSIAAPRFSHAANGFAPGMYGVTEVSVENVVFDDFDSSRKCGLTHEGIASVLRSAFTGTGVPVVASSAKRMQTINAARIRLIPEISTYLDETLGCVSWIQLSAQSQEYLSIPPIAAPREVVVTYWSRRSRVFSGLSAHTGKLSEVVKNLAEQFSRQFITDQRNQYVR